MFKDENKAKQLIDFENLKWGNKSLTDLDGLFEFQGILYVFIEYKFQDAEIPEGQSRAFISIVDGLNETDRHALFLRASHSTPAPKKVDAASAIVTSIYGKHGLYVAEDLGVVKGFGVKTVKQVIEKFFLDKIGYELK